MAEQGGYQKPNTPAAVSGPGKFSQRTDGQPGTTPKQAARYVGGGEWGTNQAFNDEVVGAAPMAAAESIQPMQQTAPTPMPPIDLFAPTERPDVPLTNGLPVGEGAGPEALQYTQKMEMQNNSDLKAIMELANVLRPIADSTSSSYATRLLLKRINSMTPPAEY
jgi:hypothetical protein